MLQRQSRSTGFAAGDGLLDELHPFRAVFNVLIVDRIRNLSSSADGPPRQAKKILLFIVNKRFVPRI
jgi:hypothetical protein